MARPRGAVRKMAMMTDDEDYEELEERDRANAEELEMIQAHLWLTDMQNLGGF